MTSETSHAARTSPQAKAIEQRLHKDATPSTQMIAITAKIPAPASPFRLGRALLSYELLHKNSLSISR